MNKTVDVIVADPSGNKTILVLTPTDRNDYADIAQKLLSLKELEGEQVAYVLADTEESRLPAMEMCGLEFCGNASRSFALYKALYSEPPLDEIDVKVSGCSRPLHALIDRQSGNVTMSMPVPDSFKYFTEKELPLNKGGTLVNIDGISHLILEDVPAMEDTFDGLRHFIYETVAPDLPAFGVMFCDTVNGLMTPVVYVKDVDTTYFEGSCASGTVAASFALAVKSHENALQYTMQQPGGVLETMVTKKEGQIEGILLQGPITLSGINTVTLPEQ
ncbi:MAG: hypothetical protein GX663_08605 [Clostridiales bacterium]|nr:hypothetical protein [Clostridiales bacterium]